MVGIWSGEHLHIADGKKLPWLQIKCSAIIVYLTNTLVFYVRHPSKVPFPWGNPNPLPTHGSLGPPESTAQMASQSVKPF